LPGNHIFKGHVLARGGTDEKAKVQGLDAPPLTFPFFVFKFLFMKKTTIKNKGGRPRVSPLSRQMQITVSNDDYELLKVLCSHTGSRPATVMRELLEEARPVLKATIEAIEAAKNNTSPPSGTLASRMLDTALNKDEPTQEDLFYMIQLKNKEGKID